MVTTSELSKLNILVAQLESIVIAATHHQQPLITFDLLVDLLSTIKYETKDTISPYQRRCEDALQALLILGARPAVRRLAASAMVRIIEKGDTISIYTRTGSLVGWLSDKMDRKSGPAACIGVAQCLGALLRAFGQKDGFRVSIGLVEINAIATKLMRYSEVSVRRAALELLQDALEGSGGGGGGGTSIPPYTEALRIITKLGVGDKSAIVRATAAGCLRAFSVTAGAEVGVGLLENCTGMCLKALEDSAQAVRDGFATCLGSLLALNANPRVQDQEQVNSKAQAQAKGKGVPPARPIDGGLHKHLIVPFIKASGPHYKETRVGLTMAWVAFLQGLTLKVQSDYSELQEFAMKAIRILATSKDTHAQACVLYCLRVGIVEQMGEMAQKQFTDLLVKQLYSADINPAMLVVILRTISHLLATLGEVSLPSRDALDNSLVAMLSNSSPAVRVEGALALRTLAEVDATSAYNLLSCGVTTLRALRETAAVEKGDRLRAELDSLFGQAAMIAALITACPRLVLGVPSRLPTAVWEVAKAMVLEGNMSPVSLGAQKEAGWVLIASIVSSMPHEEVEEQKLDILVLWTSEFGGNMEERLSRAKSTLLIYLNGWSAAVEALTAFVKSFVLPNMSPMDEGILLQPLIGFLSGALAYLSSPTLQRAPEGLKPAIDLFTIQTLRAFQSLPDPFTYKHDHADLLSICTAPFRDPALFGASSCLRQLLDSRDASLGPWVTGRDSFEDELRAFEGGSDGLLPCIWTYQVPAFPQPLPVGAVLVDEMLLCFGNLFAAQTEKGKLQLLEIVVEALRLGKGQSWHTANITNTCVALLGGLKASIGVRSLQSETEAVSQVQEILHGILGGEEGVSPAERRAAAEGLGILARLGSDVYAARLTRSLLSDAVAAPNSILKGPIAFALGCVHRSVGGMALSALVPATVQTLCTLAKDPTDGLHIWALHALWLTADAAGLSFLPHVQATLSLAMELLVSEEHAGPELGQSIGRLINAVVAVLGPELSPGSSLFIRCKAVVEQIGTGEGPGALLECVLFTQQLALFAPRAVPVHSHVKTLRPTLTSRQPSLRKAAVSTLHHLSERDAVAMCEERIEEDLFAMLDNETDGSIIQMVRSTLQRLLEEACPSLPSRWLHLCRNVVLAASSTKSAGAGSSYELDGNENDELGEDDDEEMIVERTTSGQPGKHESTTNGTNQLPRFKTRVFAAECLCRLPVVVGVDPTHFDLVKAKQLEKNGGDWLVLHLRELVAVAYQVATGTMESVRHMGVELLDTILDKFGKTGDPMFEGHLLLEQYQAQLVSAVRTALVPSAGPLLIATGSRLAARIITSGIAGGDHALLQRVVSLMTQSLLMWDDIVNANYAEWVGSKVQVSLLGAHAAVKTYAFSCAKEGSTNSSDGRIIQPLLAKHANVLGRYWVGLLRDYTVLRLYKTTKVPPKYVPFLEGIHILTIGQLVQEYLSEVWSVVLEAVTLDAYPATPGSSYSKTDEENLPAAYSKANEDNLPGTELNIEDFCQLWALSVLILSDENKQTVDRRHSVTGFPSFKLRLQTDHEPALSSQLTALGSLRCLCSKGFYSPDMLSLELCKELMQILSSVFQNKRSKTSSAVLSVLGQVVRSCPQAYIECKDITFPIVELCLGHIFQLLVSDNIVLPHGEIHSSDSIISSALQTLGNLAGHLNTESQGILLPHLLSVGIKLLNLVPAGFSGALSALVAFMTSVTVAIAKPVEGPMSDEDEFNLTTRAAVLAAAVESLAQISTEYTDESKKQADQKAETVSNFVGTRIEMMLAMVWSFPETGSSTEQGSNFREAAQMRCVHCLRSFLSSSDTRVQLAALRAVRMSAQLRSTKQPVEENRKLAALLLAEVVVDVMQTVYNATQELLTTTSAAAVGESLKLLILLHSLVEGNEAQQHVLHFLLPAIMAAATAKNEVNNSQITTALRAAAVKLVTHLASVPSSAAQFRTVLLELPPESRQQLQTIIKAALPQQTASTVIPSPAPLQLQIPKTFISAMSSGVKSFLPLPSRSLQLPATPATPVDDDDEDDDWDDFQDNKDHASGLGPGIDQVVVEDEMKENFVAFEEESQQLGNGEMESKFLSFEDGSEAVVNKDEFEAFEDSHQSLVNDDGDGFQDFTDSHHGHEKLVCEEVEDEFQDAKDGRLRKLVNQEFEEAEQGSESTHQNQATAEEVEDNFEEVFQDAPIHSSPNLSSSPVSSPNGKISARSFTVFESRGVVPQPQGSTSNSGSPRAKEVDQELKENDAQTPSV